MMNYKMWNILVFICIAVTVLQCSAHEEQTIKIMTWNIWHGGIHGDKTDDFKVDTANTTNVLEVIKQEDPDILCMQETYCCGMDIAAQAGFPFSWRGSANLSIHSKYPIRDTIHIYKPFNSHGVVIEVDGQNIFCVNVWLHYLPKYFEDIKTMPPDSLVLGEASTRLAEIQTILGSVDSLSREWNMPTVIGGDFNSGSHLDWVEKTRSAHYNKVVGWPVSKTMIEHGYTDSFRESNPDLALTLEGTYGFLFDEIISDRIDYIYYKGEGMKTKYSNIIQDDPQGGFFNSDHRAVTSVFSLNN